ncbi:hypothetical protein A3K78_10740 [Candidatus Bathyarchaeota archaeon RBG_13_52_12]|nr:MAG: hypothetical protein A3K78_10740 [Candidatus Bathyarchaeota archaeon RBG_13_52_12]
MKKVTLGRTSLKVSRVGIGGIPIQRPPISEAVKVIHRALDLGINLIDTSIGYGDSEIRIGQALKGRRDEAIIATKGSWRHRRDAGVHSPLPGDEAHGHPESALLLGNWLSKREQGADGEDQVNGPQRSRRALTNLGP